MGLPISWYELPVRIELPVRMELPVSWYELPVSIELPVGMELWLVSMNYHYRLVWNYRLVSMNYRLV
jgi:hypothetical protein